MGSGHDNKTEVVDGVLYFIGDGKQIVQLYHLESHNVNDEGSVSNVPGPAGVIGTQRAAGGFQISLKSRRAKHVEAEVDWEHMRDSDALFRFEIQKVGGRRAQYFRCRVSNTNESADASGAVTVDITITSPERKIR